MEGRRWRTPWMLVAGGAVFAALFFYTLFAAYLPARARMARLESEIREVYAREAALQTKLAQLTDRHRDLARERDLLARRLDALRRQR